MAEPRLWRYIIYINTSISWLTGSCMRVFKGRWNLCEKDLSPSSHCRTSGCSNRRNWRLSSAAVRGTQRQDGMLKHWWSAAGQITGTMRTRGPSASCLRYLVRMNHKNKGCLCSSWRGVPDYLSEVSDTWVTPLILGYKYYSNLFSLLQFWLCVL